MSYNVYWVKNRAEKMRILNTLPVRAKALIINAFALTGRIVICDTFTQGGALDYVLLPLRGVLLWLLTLPSCAISWYILIIYYFFRNSLSTSQRRV